MNNYMEALYWAALIVAGAIALWCRYRGKPAQSDVRRGEDDAANYLKSGVFPSAIQAYIEVQKSRGLSGPYERGLEKALKNKTVLKKGFK